MLILGLGLLFLGRKKERKFVLLSLLLVLISDVLTYRILKPLIASPRPFHILSGVKVLVGRSASYGFPSTHAANAFALATFSFFYYPYLSPFIYLLAFLVGFSRIYVGVHFPSDVIGGACLGILLGWGLGRWSKKREK